MKTWRVRIALNLKQLDYEYVPMHLTRAGGDQHSEAFRALNPMKHVPVLAVTHAGQTHHVAESLAIVELLDELYPQPPLLPQAPLLRARARQIALHIASGIQPLVNTKVTAHLRDDLQQDGAAWARRWLASGLAALETLVAGSAGRFAVGDQVTVADLCLVPQLFMARLLGVPLDPYPTVLSIERACSELPAFQKAEPKNQPDFEP